ncbi:MAG: hypothetical protein RL685_4163 [Pseudomonadota bacterium]|jgi:hypothetical protein
MRSGVSLPRHALALLAGPVAGLLLASPCLAAPPEIQSERVVTKRGTTVDLDVAASDSRLRVLRSEGVTLQLLPDAVQESERLPTRVSIPKGAAVMIPKPSPAAPLPSWRSWRR